MKKWLTGITAATTLAGGMLFAQTAQSPAAQPAPGPYHHRMAGPNARANHFEHFATMLNLTPQQREQAKTIFQNAKQASEPVRAQLKQNREALANAVKANRSDTEIDRIANNQGVLVGQLIAVHARAMEKVYSLLTPAQRQKADQLHQQMMQRFQHRMGRKNG